MENPNESLGKMESLDSTKQMAKETNDSGNIRARKQTYKIKKKKAAKEFSSAIKDKSVIILSSWLKIRGTLKSWAKYWCVVKPGVIIVYKSDKHHHWVGTILINNLEIIERPTSKEGFCFKLYQPYGQSIWATKGPKGEIAGALVQPMPKDHLIFRASNQEIGKCWLDALEVAQKSSMANTSAQIHSDLYGSDDHPKQDLLDNEDIFEDGLTAEEEKSDSSSGEEIIEESILREEVDEVLNPTNYVLQEEEEFGESGETTEEMEDENKSILWALLKQVRPGMDLSRVTLPTFILEPRSFLDKLSDYYYHADYLERASAEENPYGRIKGIVKWYLSGFYKKPKGLKKPYNPIIGEVFRCMWPHDKTNSKTFFIAEQVSHHPPVSAFYCSNRKDGYVVSGAILAKSKFYGNSSSAILDGSGVVSLLKWGEDYSVTMPYAHVKGILIGSLTAEYGGVVCVKCEKTGYNAEIEFKLKPFWKKSGESNYISGKIRMGNDVLSKLEGRWDSEIFITEYNKANSGSNNDYGQELFFSPSFDVKKSRLKRFVVNANAQEEYESENLWKNVSSAIRSSNQEMATKEKLYLEDNQREVHKNLKEKDEEWQARFFERDLESSAQHTWVYKYKDLRPWDPQTDVEQYEENGVIGTCTKHRVPLVKRASSSPNILNNTVNIPSDIKSCLPTINEPSEKQNKERIVSLDETSIYSTRSEEARVDRLSEQFELLHRQIEEMSGRQKEFMQRLSTIYGELRDVKRTITREEPIFSMRYAVLILAFLICQYLLRLFV